MDERKITTKKTTNCIYKTRSTACNLPKRNKATTAILVLLWINGIFVSLQSVQFRIVIKFKSNHWNPKIYTISLKIDLHKCLCCIPYLSHLFWENALKASGKYRFSSGWLMNIEWRWAWKFTIFRVARLACTFTLIMCMPNSERAAIFFFAFYAFNTFFLILFRWICERNHVNILFRIVTKRSEEGKGKTNSDRFNILMGIKWYGVYDA